MEQLQKVLDSNEYVKCKKVGEEDFWNYGKFEDTVYKHTPLTGNTKKYQLFYSSDEEPDILYAKTSSMDTTTHQMDLQRGADQEEPLNTLTLTTSKCWMRKTRESKRSNKWSCLLSGESMYQTNSSHHCTTIQEKRYFNQSKMTERARKNTLNCNVYNNNRWMRSFKQLVFWLHENRQLKNSLRLREKPLRRHLQHTRLLLSNKRKEEDLRKDPKQRLKRRSS
jgi:hypothetical protein